MKNETLTTLKWLFRPAYYWGLKVKVHILNYWHRPARPNPYNIPIIINNYNRLSFLKKQIESLEKKGYHNIYIIDNASTYPPLLSYYNNCRHKVFRLNKNVGHLSIWETGIYKKFINSYYVYTDSDILPLDSCPDNFMEVFLNKMLGDKTIFKIGFSLKIDDLPDTFRHKERVISWETQFFENQIDNLLYRAEIDTTFALYKPWVKGGANHYFKMCRTAYPYQAKHLPWYVDSSNLDSEEKYYINSVKQATHWTVLSNSDIPVTT